MLLARVTSSSVVLVAARPSECDVFWWTCARLSRNHFMSPKNSAPMSQSHIPHIPSCIPGASSTAPSARDLCGGQSRHLTEIKVCSACTVRGSFVRNGFLFGAGRQSCKSGSRWKPSYAVHTLPIWLSTHFKVPSLALVWTGHLCCASVCSKAASSSFQMRSRVSVALL